MKYMLLRGNKKQPLVGIFKENRNGRIFCKKKTFVFEPGKVVDTEEYDLSGWVDMGIAVEVKETQSENKEVQVSEDGVVPIVNVDIEESNSIEDENDSNIDKGKENNIDEPNEDYVKIDDGSFKCLRCGKTYKGESWINRHIAKRHRDNEDAI